MAEITPSILTIGHSTRTLDEFLDLIGQYGIELLLDIRTVPRSRHVPHFNSESLKRALHGQGVDYVHMKRLGGLRKPAKNSINKGWRNSSFRGFADYMQGEEFRKGLSELLDLASEKKAALMCAEAIPWRCHRSLVSDALLARGVEVRHILSEKSARLHELTPFAVVEGEQITYPEITDR